jgi:hypothetical protein
MPSTTFVDLTCDYCGKPVKRLLSEANRLKKGTRKGVYCGTCRSVTLPCALHGCDQTVKRATSQLGHSTKGKTYGAVYCCVAHRQKGTRAAISTGATKRIFPVYTWTPTPEVAAYCAGYVDGDGCITLDKQGWVEVSITSTDPIVAQWFSDHYTGKSSINTLVHTDRPQQKSVTRFRVASNQALAFLKPIEPYLLLKQDKAKIAMTYQSLRRDERLNSIEGQKLSDTFHKKTPDQQILHISQAKTMKCKDTWAAKTTTIAYIAGFFDAEGTIGIYQGRNNRYIKALIANTDSIPLLFIQQCFTGNSHLSFKPNNNLHATEMFLEINNSYAKIFLNTIIPYLVTKKERAELALQFQWLLEQKYSYSQHASLLMREIRRLNQRGIPVFMESPIHPIQS